MNKTEKMHLYTALLEAEAKFYQVLEEEFDYDGAYFSIELTGKLLSMDFKPLWSVELKEEDTGDD